MFRRDVKRHLALLARSDVSIAANVCTMTNTKMADRAPGWVPGLDTLGARLALIRQAMGWNLAQAATECGIPVASWRNWENRGKEPQGLVTISMKIAGVTGIDYRWIALGPIPEVAPTLQAANASTLRYATLGERLITRGVAERPMEIEPPRPPFRPRSNLDRQPFAVLNVVNGQL